MHRNGHLNTTKWTGRSRSLHALEGRPLCRPPIQRAVGRGWSGRVAVAAFCAALSLSAGCTAVKPWERGTLADYTMRADRDPLAEMEYEHVYFTREGASGGRGVGGGGCGCN